MKRIFWTPEAIGGLASLLRAYYTRSRSNTVRHFSMPRRRSRLCPTVGVLVGDIVLPKPSSIFRSVSDAQSAITSTSRHMTGGGESWSKMTRPKITAVDIFCGVAGLSLGLRSSGIKVAAGIDLDPACRFPFEENIGATFMEADIAAVSGNDVEQLFGGAELRLLAGCAPCQPFSGYTTRQRAIDKRWQLLLEFLRIVEAVRPELVTMENVPRLAHLPLWEGFVNQLKEIGYYVAWDVVDAAKYGVPQSRNRLVLLASRLGPIQLPLPSDQPPKTVRSAIGDQPAVVAGKPNVSDPLHAARALTLPNLKRIRTSQPGGTWRDWPEEMRVRCHRNEKGRTYPSVYGRMSWDRPSPTMTTQFYGFGNGRFGHPDQDRAITLREGALLQSFPADFKFAPPERRVNFREMGRLIGNAVPPELGKAIGSAIIGHVIQTSR